MPLPTLEFAPSAVTDLQELLEYFEGEGVPETGSRIAGELIAATEILPNHPEMGRIVPEFDTPILRELIRPPYRIIYRLLPNRVAIIRIWRSERLLRLPTA
jgi:plasmid stabilization system protein ParE